MDYLPFKQFFYYFILVFFASCSQDNEKTELKARSDTANQQKEIAISELADTYPIKYSFDTIYYKYSIEFDDLLNSDYQLITRFVIDDIYQNDESTFVKVKVGTRLKYYLDLKVSELEVKKLLTMNNREGHWVKALMVIDVHNMKKSDFISDHPNGFEGDGFIHAIKLLDE